ncbi:SIR2 family protein [Mycetocola spongiae]|uniref:SIR2 family protein n=1 Tax=Mycetocola spongiae TaxID=2859226 RepID=UPI001CF0DCF8|nr:SIR2 family protein [Mycetocola spongiae]UCR89670.1 SIR2 family protein [Mycetocola spongiae]
MDHLPVTSRPVYVLGAGFSKAVSDSMPITNALGSEIKERLSGQVDISLRNEQSFEDWLTVQITPLPFLSSHENSVRRAHADLVIAEIAAVLDQRVTAASESASPHWLRQLLTIWDVEKAVILTFNYDSLIERAVNAGELFVVGSGSNISAVLGDNVVFPAPAAPPAEIYYDVSSPHSKGTMQVIKMHGSLLWYWASDDTTGATLIRRRERNLLGDPKPYVEDNDFNGIRELDRYLVPPLIIKDGYYGTYLATVIWRSARKFIDSASSLAIMGYSLPLEDRAASQLISRIPSDIPITVADLHPGSIEPRKGILGNLADLGLTASRDTHVRASITEFVTERMKQLTTSLTNHSLLNRESGKEMELVTVIAGGRNDRFTSDYYVFTRENTSGSYSAQIVDIPVDANSEMSLNEAVLNSMPHGTGRLESFLTVEGFKSAISGGECFYFQHPHREELLVAIGLEQIVHRGRRLLRVKWAPA